MKQVDGWLLGRVALQFEPAAAHVPCDLSAAARGPDGSLLVAGDEWASLEILRPTGAHAFGAHQSHDLSAALQLAPDAEMDIEGLAFDRDAAALFVVGSHSCKRKKPRGKDPQQDLKRLATIKRDAARFVLARIPWAGDSPALDQCASLPSSGEQSLLGRLQGDEHFAPFLPDTDDARSRVALPGKDNGFDIEGLAFLRERVLAGLRGPVLRGWAFILEFEIEVGTGSLRLASHTGRGYRKHALDLDGLGVRDLLVDGDDVLILAGPTMVLDGAHRLFRWHGGPRSGQDSLVNQGKGVLEPIFDIPIEPGCDRAEGITHFSWFDENDSLLTVYDVPSSTRHPESCRVQADVFALQR
jgi:hypothetical protein